MIIIRDFKHWKSNTPSKSGFAVLLNPNFYALVNYRLGFFFGQKRLSIISKLLWLHSRIFYSIDIDWRAQIGEKFMIVHGVGIVIGAGVKIGDNCKVYQGCTIGGNGKQKSVDGIKISQPIIQDECMLYACSTLLGPITINRNSKIGSGTILQTDIPENSIVFQKRELTIRKGE